MAHARFFVFSVFTLIGSGLAQAELCAPQSDPAPPVGTQVRLSLGKTGDSLTGKFQGCSEAQAKIQHPVLGVVMVPGRSISGVRLLTDPCQAGQHQQGDHLAVRIASSGDLVAGESLGCEAGMLRLKTETLGTIALPTANVATVEVVPIGEPSIAGTDLAAVAEAPPPLWRSESSLGFDGASGNTDRSGIRFEVRADRQNETGKLHLLANFRGAQSDGSTTQEQATASARYDLNLTAPWLLSSQFRADYDRFQDYDVEWSASLGPGYQILNTPTTTWTASAGLGASQKAGDPEDGDINPVLSLGSDYLHRFGKGNALEININVLPYLNDTGEYRVVSKAEWTHRLVGSWNVDLRLGVENRYDSQPGPGRQSNDMDYYGTFVKRW